MIFSRIQPKTHAVRWEGSWRDGRCVLLDQTRLPSEERYLPLSEYAAVVRAIRDLAVRGAPAIGVSGAYAVVLASRQALSLLPDQRGLFFNQALREIAAARPTAVNLRWAVDKMRTAAGDLRSDSMTPAVVERLFELASQIHREDIESNLRMADFGASLFQGRTQAMTYCNTGDLATGGVGTAFGVIHEAYRRGSLEHVYTCETRPVLQGLRLTVWELHRNEIPFTAICDNMAGLVLREGKVGAVLVGADRIASNGDTANKVGTYGLAILAKHHQVPFWVIAPTSTFDMSLASGAEIPIEERAAEETLGVLGANRPLFDVPVRNPSFDVTPAALIDAIVCEKGIILKPSFERVRSVLECGRLANQ